MVTLNNKINIPIKILTRHNWIVIWLIVFFTLDGILFTAAFADQTSKQPPRIKIKVPKTPIFEKATYTFEFKGTDAQDKQDSLTYSWRLDNNEWSPFSSERSVLLNADDLTIGVHRFQVRAKDKDGNVDPAPAAVVFKIIPDLYPPETTIRIKPNVIKSIDYTFQFEGIDGQTPEDELQYSWRIDLGGWSEFSFQRSAYLSKLVDGVHLFEVKAKDESGNEDTTPAKVPFKVSIQEPDTVIINPPEIVKVSDVTFRFSGTDPQTPKEKLKYSWCLDNQRWTPFSSETSAHLTNLSDGTHKFYVKARDEDENEDSSPAEAVFKVFINIELPNTEITKIISEPNGSFTFHFKGIDLQTPDKLQYSWRVDEEKWSEFSEATSTTVRKLKNGVYLFQVKAIDADGNKDPTPAMTAFKMEQLPETEIVSQPEYTVKTSNVTIQFRGSDLQTPFEQLRYKWRLDGGKWSDELKATSIPLNDLSGGLHTFEVKAIDADGNEDSTPERIKFEVSIEKKFPKTEITHPTENEVLETADVTFQFTGSYDQASAEELRYSWRIGEEKEWSTSSTETTFNRELPDGRYLFQVKAIADDNEDLTPAEVWFTVDTQGKFPDTKITDYPKDIVKETEDVTFKFIGEDLQTEPNQLNYSWRIDSNQWSKPNTKTEVQYKQRLSKGLHWFEVKAIDGDGNEDPDPDKKPFVIDEKFPETEIIKPSMNDVLEAVDVTFQFTGSYNQTSAEKLQYSWRTDIENWSPPLIQMTVTRRFPDGPHWFQVKAIADGKEDQTPAGVSFTVNTQNFPDTEIIDYPKDIITTQDVTFKFTGSDLQTKADQLKYSWRIDSNQWSKPPAKETAVQYKQKLSKGLHQFEVKAIDTDGHEDQTPDIEKFAVGDIPDTKITITASKQIYTSADFEIPFEVIAPETLMDKLRYSWRLDGGDWSETKETSVPLKDLSDGWHTFKVKAVDTDGNESLSAEPIKFFVDTKRQYPETEIINAPQKTIETADVTILFRGEDWQTPAEKLRYSWRVSETERIDETEWSEPSKATIALLEYLSDGWYCFQVKAVDTNEKEDPMPAEARFKVAINETFPKTQINWDIQKVLLTKSNVKIDFTGEDSETPPEQLCYKWRLDGGDWFETKGTSVHLKDLLNEWHIFEVKAIDTDDNEDPTSATRQFLVDVPRYKTILYVSLSSVIILTALFIFVTRYITKKKERRIQTLRSVIDDWAHQLKTPLSRLKLSIEESPGFIYKEIAEHETASLLKMTSEILDLKRLEEGVSILHIEDGTIQDIVTEVIDRVWYAAEEKKIDINTCIPEQSVIVHWDTEKIISVLYNIVVNAIEHSRSPKIDISCHIENNSVCFKIADYGIGIAREDIPKIFEKFWKKDKYSPKGAGLGLAFAKAIVEEHKGKIEVESELGKGSTFSVYIPIYFRRKG